MIRCSTLHPHLSHLPNCDAVYILSQRGLVVYVGCTNNLRRRMREHKTQNENISFDKTALVHYFDVCDLSLESELQRALRPGTGRISIYSSLDVLPLIIRDFYLKRVNRLVDNMPDDFEQSLPYFQEATQYHRIIEKLFPENKAIRQQWQRNTEAISRMVKSSEKVLV